VDDDMANLIVAQLLYLDSQDPETDITVYVNSPGDTTHTVVRAPKPGPQGQQWCWYQCTVAGGREGRDIDAVALAKAEFGGRKAAAVAQLSTK
jgi:hypothetical protein